MKGRQTLKKKKSINFMKKRGYWGGKVRDEKTRKKISDTNKRKGLMPPVDRKPHSKETKNKISESLKGRKQTEEHKRKNSESKKGEKNPSWKGGLTIENKKIRNSKEYKLWRKAVIERDKECIWCGNKENLEADHIKPLALFPELRFAIDNGRALCNKCHKKTKTYGGRTK